MQKHHLQQQISNLNLEKNVELTGQISMEQYRMEMNNCDVVLNACLKEGGVTNAFDCMTWGKPLICVDTGGYTRNFDDECAIILPRTGRDELIEKLANSILCLRARDVRETMSKAMLRKGDEITWEIKGLQIRNEIMKAWNDK